MANPVLFTFGYEGVSIRDFIDRLKSAGIDRVIDVRELPLSRKKGFSKSAFSQALAGAGIAYEHLPEFGCPKPIRDRYRNDSDWSRYTRDFRSYLRGKIPEISTFADRVTSERMCLVCYEADSNFCHRSMIADAVATKRPVRVNHLSAIEALAA